ncbi:MAG: arsenate reductase ArsC [Epsilonproteobacteria bacterium]|nr:MAG: arsenate reductase ArsC [Campylobacterota bacterium]
MKRILVLCTGNSCRSIMLEAILNKDFKNKISAKSAGVQHSGCVHPYTKKVLQKYGYWQDEYRSKALGEVLNGVNEFDIVITVCDHANSKCPIFPNNTIVLHIGFDDPAKEGFSGFIKLFKNMKDIFHEEYFDEIKL